MIAPGRSSCQSWKLTASACAPATAAIRGPFAATIDRRERIGHQDPCVPRVVRPDGAQERRSCRRPLAAGLRHRATAARPSRAPASTATRDPPRPRARGSPDPRSGPGGWRWRPRRARGAEPLCSPREGRDAPASVSAAIDAKTVQRSRTGRPWKATPEMWSYVQIAPKPAASALRAASTSAGALTSMGLRTMSVCIAAARGA